MSSELLVDRIVDRWAISQIRMIAVRDGCVLEAPTTQLQPARHEGWPRYTVEISAEGDNRPSRHRCVHCMPGHETIIQAWWLLRQGRVGAGRRALARWHVGPVVHCVQKHTEAEERHRSGVG